MFLCYYVLAPLFLLRVELALVTFWEFSTMASTKYPVSPRFLVKCTIKELLADTSKVCILWKSAVYRGADDDYEMTGETRQKWQETKVSECARIWLNIVISHLPIDECKGDLFKTLFGWNWDETPKEQRREKYLSLPKGWQERYLLSDPDTQSFSEIVSDWCEAGEGQSWLAILTPKDAGRTKSNLWAQKMNQRGSEFCAKHKVNFGTIQFFNAISKEIRQAKNARKDYFGGEQSAERYATYRACGSSSYWEDNDYMSSRLDQPIHELQELLRFCRLKLPCQYALWKESRMKK